MNVQQLINILSDCDPTMEVIVSSDLEANSVSPLQEASTEYYLPDTVYYGDLIAIEDIESGEIYAGDCWEVIVLWPSN